MKANRKHMDEADRIIETSLIGQGFEISDGFVDRVMDSVINLAPVKSKWKYMINIAAAAAIVMSLANVGLMLKKINTSTEKQMIEEWAGIYELQNEQLWSNYYDIELLASNENMK